VSRSKKPYLSAQKKTEAKMELNDNLYLICDEESWEEPQVIPDEIFWSGLEFWIGDSPEGTL